jgi:hypothetical protein
VRAGGAQETLIGRRYQRCKFRRKCGSITHSSYHSPDRIARSLFPGLSREYLAERPIRVHESTRMGGSLRCAPKVVWSSRQPAGLAGALLPLKAKSITNGLVALHARITSSRVGGVSSYLLTRLSSNARAARPRGSAATAEDATLMNPVADRAGPCRSTRSVCAIARPLSIQLS